MDIHSVIGGKYTYREVIDFVEAKLIEQGRPSLAAGIDAALSPAHEGDYDFITPAVSCAYRGEGSAKCAIGHLVPDSIYTPLMEGRSVAALFPTFNGDSEFIFNVPVVGHSVVVFLSSLQDAHDEAYNIAVQTYSPEVRDLGWADRLKEMMDELRQELHEDGVLDMIVGEG